MKILTISTVKDVFCTLPVSEQQKIMKTAVKNILDVKKRLGDRVQFYGEIGWGRTVSIGEHASVEEYVQCIQGDQSRASCWNMETYLLSEVDEKALQAYVDSL
jgi:hypothetical protein